MALIITHAAGAILNSFINQSDMGNMPPNDLDVCLITQSCLTLCDPRDCSLLGSSVYGIFQTKILEWVAIPFSSVIFWTQGSNPRFLYCTEILNHLGHQGSPNDL